MRTRFRSEADNWNTDGSRITEPAKLEAIRRTLTEEGPIIVEHWFYHGASAPERRVFEDFDEFTTWLDVHTYARCRRRDRCLELGGEVSTRTGDWRRESARMIKVWFRKAVPIRTVPTNQLTRRRWSR